MSGPVAIYVHVPFCPSKCGYCDFNSFAMTGPIQGETVDAMEHEIRTSPRAGRPAKTIFFGGGTPTYLEASQLARLLQAVLDTHPASNETEITTESNPGTVTLEKLGALKEAGFNRLSLGAQSFATQDLVQLGRVHGVAEIAEAVTAARQAGFENLNLDLMFGLPGQNLVRWRHNLDQALALHPDHLSLYGLTIEPNTRFFRYFQRGWLDLPAEDTMVAMYEEAVARMTAAGLEPYEISNFARPGRRCQHNLAYWRAEEYIGYGPGAVGRVGTRRGTNLKHPARYVEAVRAGEPLWFEEEELSDDDLRLERIMLGIRIEEGLDLAQVPLSAAAIASVTEPGWATTEGDRLRLTPAGRHFTSEVAVRLA